MDFGFYRAQRICAHMQLQTKLGFVQVGDERLLQYA